MNDKYFRQLKRKVETNDDKINDLYSFDLWNIYNFDPNLSAPLTGDELVTILNVVLVVRYRIMGLATSN